jgi:hypothetical protein
MNYASVLFSEIFEEFSKQKNRENRLAVLRKYGQNVWFKEFLNYTFNPKIQFDIIQIPNYRPAVEPAGVCYSNLSNEMRRLYIFIVGHPKRTAKLDARKEARILNALLGSIHKEEAELLVKCFKKDLEIPYLTPSLIKEAFPAMPFELPQTVAEPAVEVSKVKKIKTTGGTVKV